MGEGVDKVKPAGVSKSGNNLNPPLDLSHVF